MHGVDCDKVVRHMPGRGTLIRLSADGACARCNLCAGPQANAFDAPNLAIRLGPDYVLYGVIATHKDNWLVIYFTYITADQFPGQHNTCHSARNAAT